MSDSVLYCRTLATRLAESGQALRVATRRWRDTTDAGRAAWNDEAGRGIFQRYLDPYVESLGRAEPSLLTASECHHTAMNHLDEGDRAVTAALGAARQAVLHAEDAANGVITARSECSASRRQAAQALADAREALATISQLGGE